MDRDSKKESDRSRKEMDRDSKKRIRQK